jgi:hypothetical protein
MGTLSSIQSFRGGYLSPCGAACEYAPESTDCAVNPVPAQRLLSPLGKLPTGKPEQSFHDLRAVVMTSQPGTRKALPSSGQENPELPALVLYIPRKNEREPRPRATKTPRRVSHGSARARKNLRGVRMSLVPRPYTGERLLQEVREETERFSCTREPKTARATGERRATERVATEWAPVPSLGSS